MGLRLYQHPLSPFCQKVLIALYENATPFEPVMINFRDEHSMAQLKKVSPLGRLPVLRDEARGRTVPESSVAIEYLAQFYPGNTALVPRDPDLAWQARLWDRFYDLYVSVPTGKIWSDRLRPPGTNDLVGVDQAKSLLMTAYGMIEVAIAGKRWALGNSFTIADCSAAPALFYAEKVLPLDTHQNTAGYLKRLLDRPSFARAIREAEPYFGIMPA